MKDDKGARPISNVTVVLPEALVGPQHIKDQDPIPPPWGWVDAAADDRGCQAPSPQTRSLHPRYRPGFEVQETMGRAEDLAEINAVAALYGHLIDSKQWQRMDEVYTSDAIYDGSTSGAHEGLTAIIEYLSTRPTSIHLCSNVSVDVDRDMASGAAKYIVIRSDMSMSAGDYTDVWRRTPNGWRLSQRTSRARITGAFSKAPPK